MHEAAYFILVILTAACGAVGGWRRGMAGLTPAVLAFAFGAVCAHIAAPWAEAEVMEAGRFSASDCRTPFIVGNLARGAVFIAVYAAVALLTSVVGKLLRGIATGVLSSLFGAVFGTFVWAMWTSVALNAIVALGIDPRLEKYGDAADGNAITEVMLLAPAILGCDDIADLWHACRLRDAKLISDARTSDPTVVITEATGSSADTGTVTRGRDRLILPLNTLDNVYAQSQRLARRNRWQRDIERDKS